MFQFNKSNLIIILLDMVSMRVPLTDKSAHALYEAMDENVPKEVSASSLRH